MAERLPTSSSSGRRRREADASIGDFVIGGEIGKGSFAQVYSGYHKSSKATVAIKSVETGRLNNKLRENLYGEIQILKTLRHPHIVALHDCVESATHINLVMEYCELGDLSLFIKKRDKLSTNPATHDMARKYPVTPNSGLHEVVTRHFLQQLGSALKFLRERNYVHRDVKPQNLLLLPSPKFREEHSRPILTASQDSLIPNAGLASLPMLKLADFGFARVLPSTSLADTLCGSPLYMAPEILRYERYDAKADLWSVGTVLYEMITGRPPFRARNHVELLRKIESAEDRVKYPKDLVVSKELVKLISKLLTRAPVERMRFEDFFNDPIVVGPIPGVVEDDIPKPEVKPSRDLRSLGRSDSTSSLSRRLSLRRQTENETVREEGESPRSPREKPLRSPRLSGPSEGRAQQAADATARVSQSPGQETGDGLGIRRPAMPQPSTSAPARPHRLSNAAINRPAARASASPPTSYLNERRLRPVTERSMTEQEKAAQDVAFERDYVVVEKKHVEVNAFADEMAANPRLTSLSPKTGQMIRRATQQGPPTSTTGAGRVQPSNAVQIASGKGRHDRRDSYDSKNFSASPTTQGFIAKAISDASVRLFGFKVPQHVLGGKGASPPLYSPFPAYPTPSGPVALIGDGKQSAPVDEDARAVKLIQDFAHRSDCVYGFAEVKYKQLFPLAPSMDHGLGGAPADQLTGEEDGLTIEAEVLLSEEALVLYVKALTLLARAMDVASLWWSRKTRGDSTGAAAAEVSKESLAQRINSTVQWVRGRFNEVLEKTEVVRLKLIAVQQKLPDDHPSHPSNHGGESASSTASGTRDVYLTPGISAEKLMYDRALEMSRTAAIDEITNENLEGCVTYYVTAIRMLEAVLDNDEDTVKRRYSASSKELVRDEVSSDLDSDDQQVVNRMIQMITGRLSTVRKKMAMIAEASRSQQAMQLPVRKRSGDVTPRSVPSYAS
ncbi:Serine/threonine-protein kinase ATG1 [Colletotrichum fructicola]|nr:Serine/threonine-protein kinase ATG1 [Colletotrichum siamense]KAF4875874.1 Serine/threonine-protein kinase ATG1 [Colletotrichum siamense]KAF4898369.1 Serine/threonine-protein kinase ATG1 [Colletotrichum fructicola]KAF4938324.1 Serine/threonine-protein kinase ATG1 [Colletotrichum fructicola]KAF5513306.1 Serine/threonine-protein kinase ATG1 [Colletotrichum fructicola]